MEGGTARWAGISVYVCVFMYTVHTHTPTQNLRDTNHHKIPEILATIQAGLLDRRFRCHVIK